MPGAFVFPLDLTKFPTRQTERIQRDQDPVLLAVLIGVARSSSGGPTHSSSSAAAVGTLEHPNPAGQYPTAIDELERRGVTPHMGRRKEGPGSRGTWLLPVATLCCTRVHLIVGDHGVEEVDVGVRRLSGQHMAASCHLRACSVSSRVAAQFLSAWPLRLR